MILKKIKQESVNYLQDFVRSCFKNIVTVIKVKPIALPVPPISYLKPIEAVRKKKHEMLGAEKNEKNVDETSVLANIEKTVICQFEKETILSGHLQKINKKLVQKVLLKNLSKETVKTENVKCQKTKRNSEKNEDVKKRENKKIKLSRQNMGLVKFLETELEHMEKYLRLHTEDFHFVKENVHITLHISVKEMDVGNLSLMKTRRQKVRSLCKQAILCLIEPSENAFVRYENDLPGVINGYISLGCIRHFDTPNKVTFFRAVLVLSPWAKILLRHPNSTLIQTISCILGFDSHRILVLSYPDILEK